MQVEPLHTFVISETLTLSVKKGRIWCNDCKEVPGDIWDGLPSEIKWRLIATASSQGTVTLIIS